MTSPYTVRYENKGEHVEITDRYYNGGTIINCKVPRTGDDSNISLWLSLLGISMFGLAGALYANKKKRKDVL